MFPLRLQLSRVGDVANLVDGILLQCAHFSPIPPAVIVKPLWKKKATQDLNDVINDNHFFYSECYNILVLRFSTSDM
jgi:hypothetical protein